MKLNQKHIKNRPIKFNALSQRLFLAGLFLYWGEGTKAQNSLVALTNTNPAMLKFFIKWLKLFGIKNKNVNFKNRNWFFFIVKK